MALLEVNNLKKYCDLDRILEILRKEKLVKPKQELTDITFYRPKSSKTCPEGYKGRVGIYEALPVTESIKVLIVKEATADQVQEQAQKEGMKPAEFSFKNALAVEEIHYGLYSKALQAVQAGNDLTTTPIYVCPVCGNTVEGSVPDQCPICNVPGERFFEVA